jgi:hypothetical protein
MRRFTSDKKILIPKFMVSVIIVYVFVSLYFLIPVNAQIPEFIGVPQAASLLSSMSFKEIQNHWARVPLIRSIGLGIFRGRDGKLLPDSRVSREEVLAVITRLMGKDDEAQKLGYNGMQTSPNISAARGSVKNPNASGWAYGYLEFASREGIVTKEEAETIDWQKAALREEAAAWISKAMRLSPLFGESQSIVAKFTDSNKISNDYLPHFASAVKKGILSGSAGRVRPKDEMTRGELAAVVDRIRGDIPGGFLFYRGIVISTYSVNVREAGTSGSYSIFEVKNADGMRYDLKTESIIFNGWEKTENDFIVIRGNSIGLSGMLRQGDYIEYAVRDGRVYFASVIPSSSSAITGKLVSISESDGQVLLKLGDSISQYKLEGHVEVAVDDRPAKLADLVFGFDVTVYLENGRVRHISAKSDREPGYIQPGSRRLEGMVRSVKERHPNYEVILILADGSKKSFIISPYTAVVKNSGQIRAGEIKPGYSVMAYFDSHMNDTAEKVAVADMSKVKNILKGRVVRSLGNELLLEDVQRYYFGSWIRHSGSLKVPVSAGASVYFRGERLDMHQLGESHLRDYVYILTKDDFGQEAGESIVIKSGDEYLANGEIDQLKWSEMLIEVGGIEAVIKDETVIVAENETADVSTIDEDREVFLITNKSGEVNNAVAVVQPEYYGVDMEIYKGRIDEIYRNGFSICRYGYLENHKWSKVRQTSIDFSFGDYVYIIDATGSQMQVISPEDFIVDRFIHEYYGKNVYMIVKNDKAEGILILDGEADNEIISIGEMVSAGVDTQSKLLKNKKDYSTFRKMWNVTTDDMQVDISRALVVKDGQFIDVEDIKSSDTLYIIRDNQIVLVCIVLK